MASDQLDHELEELLDSALSDFGVRTEGTNAPSAAEASSTTATAPSVTPLVSASAASSSATAAAAPSGVAGLGSTPLLPRKKKKNKPPLAPPSLDQPNQQADQLAASLSHLMAGLLEGEKGTGGESSSGVSQGVSDTLAALAAQTKTAIEGLDGGAGAARMEDGNEALVAELAAQMQALGGEGEVQSLMDSMMRQLLSKDVLAEPMRDIAERYPAWLERNAATLPPEDLRRFRKQHEHVQEICQLYETDPENFPRLVQLLQEMQDCGQPPQEIVKELAPGMEFGMDGMPKFNAGDASTMPGDLNNCSIM
eukprot:jgi/Chlat1/6268/Chrsp44S09053